MHADETELIARLLIREVPEIAVGLVEIKSIARKKGNRSKVALKCLDPSLDAIGACIGEHGSRIHQIVNELGGERLDLVLWGDSPETLIINALQPARIDQWPHGTALVAITLRPSRCSMCEKAQSSETVSGQKNPLPSFTMRCRSSNQTFSTHGWVKSQIHRPLEASKSQPGKPAKKPFPGPNRIPRHFESKAICLVVDYSSRPRKTAWRRRP
jgi:hypothetical protein